MFEVFALFEKYRGITASAKRESSDTPFSCTRLPVSSKPRPPLLDGGDSIVPININLFTKLGLDSARCTAIMPPTACETIAVL